MVTLSDDVDVVLCDLDGVIWLDGEPIAGSVDAIARFRSEGRQVLFVTNNSGPRRADHERRLARIGIEATGLVLTSAVAAAALVHEGDRVLVCAGPGVVEAITERGAEAIPIDGRAGSSSMVDTVVVGRYDGFDYEALGRAARAIRDGARFVATNGDPTFPRPDGLAPGAGALVAAVAVAAGVEPEVAGKPHAAMAGVVHSALAATRGANHWVMVGDRMSTDGAFAQRLGCRFVHITATTDAAVVDGDSRANDVTRDAVTSAPVTAWRSVDRLADLMITDTGVAER